MKTSKFLTDDAILAEIDERIARRRLDLHRRKRESPQDLFLTLPHGLMTAKNRVHDIDILEGSNIMLAEPLFQD